MRRMYMMSAIMLLGLGAVPAKAMPFGPPPGAPSSVTLVAMGCGPGWTRGPYGHCHPMGYVAPHLYGYGYYHPYARPYAYPRCWWRAGVRVCA
jgi:hypothetical protein